MMRTCTVFDKYRDGELNSAERNEFEKHLAVCEECRTKMALLNNLVHVLKQEEIKPLDRADRIARQAFSTGKSWDALVVSWLRPGPALAALTLVLLFFSFLWITPGDQQINEYSEYQQLMDEADEIVLGMSVSQVSNDSELVLWLNQEGNSQ
jgi:anti-sigma factor RsiW